MGGVHKEISSPNAPKGTLRTCQHCAKAKIKCDYAHTDQGAPCTRCKRLGKKCEVLPARRRRNNGDRDARIESLEATLQALLESRTSSPATTHHDSTVQDNDRDRTSSSGPSAGIAHSDPSTASMAPTGTTFVPLAVVDEPTDKSYCLGRLISNEAAERLLQRFNTAMTPHFPFVVLTQHMTAWSLQQERPLLLLSILAAAAYDDVALQRRLGDEVKRSVTYRLLYAEAMSFEMLQALLVYLAWSQYHSRPRRYTQYLQLAISIAIDLRLDRHPNTRPWKTRVDVRADAADGKELLGFDERRALAGCYYLSCSVSKLLQKHCTFLWSPHIEECCKSLLERGQYPLDRYLYYTVKLQHVLEQADSGTLPASTASNGARPHSAEANDSAHGSALAQLRSTVHDIKASLPFSVHESPFLKMQIYTTELYLCLTGISTNATLNTLPTEEQWPSWRLEFLSAGMVAAKSLLEFLLTQPPGTEQNHNNTEWIQTSFALTLAARLTVLTHQQSIQRETAHLRSFLDVSGILQDFLNRIPGMGTERFDDKGDRDVFYHSECRLKRLQTWFEMQSSSVRPRSLEGARETPQLNGQQPGAAMNHLPQSAPANDVAVQPDMSSSFFQLDDSSLWLDDAWFDGLMDFSDAGNQNLGLGELGWDGQDGVTGTSRMSATGSSNH